MSRYAEGAKSSEMLNKLANALPPPQRIALAWAPGRTKRFVLGLFALDAHCARLVRQSREPMLAQMRLAWWRETLALDPATRPSGDPLLDLLAGWQDEEEALVAMVAGWESLLGASPLPEQDFDSFAMGRAGAFAALARLLECPVAAEAALHAGRRWAVADLVSHLGDPGERACVLALAARLGSARIALPPVLRTLAVLDGLACRSLRRGGAALLADRTSALVALRLGMAGR